LISPAKQTNASTWLLFGMTLHRTGAPVPSSAVLLHAGANVFVRAGAAGVKLIDITPSWRRGMGM
jgi:hypothetical protein